jgi:glycosyltransferase involved in cell wall biosynthesis
MPHTAPFETLPLDVLFLSQNPPSPDGTAIGARLSNNRMWDMIGTLADRTEVIPVGDLLAAETTGSLREQPLSEQLEGLQPKKILIETPGPAELKLLREQIPETMHDRVLALWRYTVLPRQPLPGTTHEQWQELLEARITFASSIGLNVCISPHQRLELLSKGVPEEKIIVIPNQVGWENSPGKRKSPEADRLRAEYLEPDELGVLVVSRVHPEKGLDWLPGLIKTLREERRHLNGSAPFRKARITLMGPVGDQTFADALFAQIAEAEAGSEDNRLAEAITFNYIDEQRGDALDGIYNAYDVLLAPSPEEGFPRVPVEAMASGMTIIGNGHCPSTANIITLSPYTIGQTAPTPKKAAEQILLMMNDSRRLELMQHNAVQWATGHYTYDRALDGLRRALGL